MIATLTKWPRLAVTAAAIIGLPIFAAAQVPNPLLTPGQQRKMPEAQLCSGDVQEKPLTGSQRDEALRRYGRQPGDAVELDHLIPVSLGGTNDPDNLWPAPKNKGMGLEEKRTLEGKLQQLVCAKTMTLKAAQEAIRRDWIKAYAKYVGDATHAELHP